MLALLVMAAGALLLSFYAGLLPYTVKSIIFSWQTLLIAIGIVTIAQPRNQGSGFILIAIGSVFLLPKIFGRLYPFYQNGPALSWAIILILIGIYLLFKTLFGKHPFTFCVHTHHHHDSASFRHARDHYGARTYNDADYIERNYVFGGGNEKITTQNFKGGDINCVFGGMELDLSDAQLAEGTHTLEINNVFGGTTLYIPAHWKVQIRPTSVFGSFQDRRPKPYFEVEENKTLMVEVSSVFGGGEIRSK